MSQPERLYWIDAQIRAGHYPNAQAVCQQFEVSCRTAYTDRDYLIQRLHAPLKFERSHSGWVYTDPTYILPFLALTEAEAATLRRSLLAAAEYLDDSEGAMVQRLATHLLPYVSPSPGVQAESMSGAVHASCNVSISDRLLDDCRQAIARRYRLRLLYYSAHRDQTGERIVQPCHLHYWRGEPYLIAWCEWRTAYRDFFLGRIREWSMMDGEVVFQRDNTFDVAAYLAGSFHVMHGEDAVTVRVRFSPYQARWIRERRYHPSQEIEETAEGGVMLTLRVAGTFEVGRWLRTFGAEAEVLEPASLRAELAADVQKLRRIYL